MDQIENMGGGEKEGGREAGETAGRDRPRIYVASLADYNAGRLVGTWIEADQQPEELQAAVSAMLARSSESVAEEWAIHSYEGFGTLRLSEYESLETVARLAAGIAEHGPAFAALAEIVGADQEDVLRHFEDQYLGAFESMTDFARQFCDDLGWETKLGQLPEGLRRYVEIDYEQLGFDLATELDGVSNGEGGIYVFDTRL